MKEWLDLFRNLGDAFLELVGAEIDALAADLQRGGRNAARAALLIAIAFVLAVLAWSLFTVALVWGLSTVMRGWLAALLVGAVYAVVAIVCAAGARRQLARSRSAPRHRQASLERAEHLVPRAPVGSGSGGEGLSMTLEPRNETAPQAALDASRRQVEDRLGALRQALHDSTGGRLGRRTWTLPLVAAAAGFSLALLLRRRRRG